MAQHIRLLEIEKLLEPTLEPFRTFMQTVIIDIEFVFINYWSIAHFLAGFILAKQKLFKLTLPKVIIILIVYELIEVHIPFMRIGSNLFTESFADKFWDVIIGTLGYIITKKYWMK